MDNKAKPSFLDRHPGIKDTLSMVIFIVVVIVGTILLNTLVFRSYNVVGTSMEDTLHPGDRIIVNRLAVSVAHFMGQEFVPDRGQIIIFANGGNSDRLTCEANTNIKDQYIIKRTIAFPGERVQVRDGILTVWTDPNDDSTAFHPDDYTRISPTDGPKEPTDGAIDVIVPPGELFVSGDNRVGEHSYDSRNGLGTIPLCRIVGPAALRLFPVNAFRTF